MVALSSQIDPSAAEFVRRRERMEALVAELRERTAIVAQGGSASALERHRARGKLHARERIDRLVDPGSAFLELLRAPPASASARARLPRPGSSPGSESSRGAAA